jgi:hypothetical protein
MQRMLKPQKAFNATDIKHSMLHCMACKGRERETDTPMGSKAPEGAGQEGHVKDIKSLAVLKGANSNRQH